MTPKKKETLKAEMKDLRAEIKETFAPALKAANKVKVEAIREASKAQAQVDRRKKRIAKIQEMLKK